MTAILRRGKAHLWSGPHRSFAETVRFQRDAFTRAEVLVRAFYAANLLLVVIQMTLWPDLLRVESVDPQWPVAWLPRDDAGPAIGVVLTLWTLSALWAMALPTWRSARIATFVLLLQYVGIVNSFGKVNHDLHAWLWATAVLVFLPRVAAGGARVVDRHRYLTVIWSAQALTLFFYTLTGLWKVFYGVRDLLGARTSGFEIDGFSLIVAQRLNETSQDTVLGHWLVHTPVVGWLLFVGTMYLEASSLLIAFRPRLHRVWGIGLIVFHLGTQLAMGFTFRANVLLLGLLFVCSPAAPSPVRVRDAALDLPGVHLVARAVERRRRRQLSRSGRADPASPDPGRPEAAPARTTP
jgi:hypothetical protein